MGDFFGDDSRTPQFEARRIRIALARECGPGGRYDAVRFDAYNREEAAAVKALLTPDERRRVVFTWWTWGEAAR